MQRQQGESASTFHPAFPNTNILYTPICTFVKMSTLTLAQYYEPNDLDLTSFSINFLSSCSGIQPRIPTLHIAMGFLFSPYHVTCSILVPWPGLNPRPPGSLSHNHWTAREDPAMGFLEACFDVSRIKIHLIINIVLQWKLGFCFLAAAAAKSLQSCPTLCDPIDSRLAEHKITECLRF